MNKNRKYFKKSNNDILKERKFYFLLKKYSISTENSKNLDFTDWFKNKKY